MRPDQPLLATPPDVGEVPWTLEVLGAPVFAATVFGTPAPQGSKTARPIYRGSGKDRVFTGKVALQESSKKVKPWREQVAEAARAQTTVSPAPWVLMDGPLVVDMIFTMPKGSSLAKWRDWHDVTPDLSKLARSTEDALSKIVWTDDGRITAYRRLEARFTGSGDPDTLPSPGAVIRVWPVPAALVEARKDLGQRRLL